MKGDYSLPKKGCTFNVKNKYENINFSSETIDKVGFKSVILTMSGWFIVQSHYKPQRRMYKLLQDIKNTINKKGNKHYFNGMVIDIIEIPHTFDEQRTGYVTFEFNIFVNKGVKFNKQEVTMVMNELIDEIYYEYFGEPMDFEVYKNRTEFRKRPELITWNPDNYYPGDETPESERL